mgnify:CR=1 FL=1
MHVSSYIWILWSAPLQIAIALWQLYEVIGPSLFAGFAVMVLMMPLNGFVATKQRNLQIQQMKLKDERIKLMNEVLSGIKVSVSVSGLSPPPCSPLVPMGRENTGHWLTGDKVVCVGAVV